MRLEQMTEPREAITGFTTRRRLSERTLRRWLAWEPPDGLALLTLAEELLPSENHLSEIMDWLEEIDLREGVPPATLLGEASLTGRLANKRVGRSDRLKQVKTQIWRRRFPRLAALEAELGRLAAEAGLRGRQLGVRFPAALEGDEITVELNAGSEGQLRGLIEHLRECLDRGVFARLFSRLHGGR